MAKLNFKDKIKSKIDVNNRKRAELEKNKDYYKKELKDKIIKRLEERLLAQVPTYVEKNEFTLPGILFYVEKNQSKLSIEYKYEDTRVFFNDFNEIEEFTKEIVAEFVEGLKYKVEVFTEPFMGYVGKIDFEYEYKES